MVGGGGQRTIGSGMTGFPPDRKILHLRMPKSNRLSTLGSDFSDGVHWTLVVGWPEFEAGSGGSEVPAPVPVVAGHRPP